GVHCEYKLNAGPGYRYVLRTLLPEESGHSSEAGQWIVELYDGESVDDVSYPVYIRVNESQETQIDLAILKIAPHI
ncbi:hypothetical protein PFISCL1PPCAC_12565, partial [Pristionchus fissidentatus]